MADRWAKQFVKSPDSELYELDGYIAIAADASVISSTIPWSSVAKTGTGQYTITLTSAFPKAKAIIPVFEAATPVALWAQLTSHDVASAKTIVITLVNGSGSATDPAAGCGVHVAIKLKNSSLGVGQ